MTGVLWLDEYERPARMAPGLIALLPIPIVITALGLQKNPVLAILVSLLVAVGGPLVLAHYVRSRGRSTQDRLYAEWGGAPSTLLLQTGADPLSSQRRASVERVTKSKLPPSSLGFRDSEDQVFEAAVTQLRQKTYDHKAYPMIFAENKNYGFIRNAYGIRPEAIGLSALASIVLLMRLIFRLAGHGGFSPAAIVAGLIIDLITLAWWIAWPSDERVHDAARLYAAQLLDAASGM